MEQKKINLETVDSTRIHLVIEVPNKERSLSVVPGTFIRTDTHTFLCIESPTPPHCLDCDAPRDMCRIMCCMPFDRYDEKFIQFKCVSVDE